MHRWATSGIPAKTETVLLNAGSCIGPSFAAWWLGKAANWSTPKPYPKTTDFFKKMPISTSPFPSLKSWSISPTSWVHKGPKREDNSSQQRCLLSQAATCLGNPMQYLPLQQQGRGRGGYSIFSSPSWCWARKPGSRLHASSKLQSCESVCTCSISWERKGWEQGDGRDPSTLE